MDEITPRIQGLATALTPLVPLPKGPLESMLGLGRAAQHFEGTE